MRCEDERRYFGDLAFEDLTSLGLRFFDFCRGCLSAICVESLFVGTDSPQNRHTAVPAEM
jgi:hypothetical protein